MQSVQLIGISNSSGVLPRNSNLRATDRPLTYRKQESTLSSDYSPEKNSPSEFQKSPTALPFFGLSESQEALLSQIKTINRKQGRDADACIRQVIAVTSPKPRLPKNSGGFHGIAKSQYDREKITRTTRPSKQQMISPSQKRAKTLQKELERERITTSEWGVLKSCRDAKVSATKAMMERTLGRELQTLNSKGIFPPRENEVRATTLVNVKLQSHIKLTMKNYIQEEKEKLISSRKPQSSKKVKVVQSSEEIEKLEDERKKKLLNELEGKLVDKIARAERNAKDADDKFGILRLTSDQIEAKLEKMKTDSNKRQKPLMTLKNLPVLDMSLGQKRKMPET